MGAFAEAEISLVTPISRWKWPVPATWLRSSKERNRPALVTWPLVMLETRAYGESSQLVYGRQGSWVRFPRIFWPFYVILGDEIQTGAVLEADSIFDSFQACSLAFSKLHRSESTHHLNKHVWQGGANPEGQIGWTSRTVWRHGRLYEVCHRNWSRVKQRGEELVERGLQECRWCPAIVLARHFLHWAKDRGFWKETKHGQGVPREDRKGAQWHLPRRSRKNNAWFSQKRF